MTTARETRRHQRERAFTMVQLIAILMILAVVAAVLVPTVAALRGRARTTTCTANLPQLVAAYKRLLTGAAKPGAPPWAQTFKEKSGLPDEVYVCPDLTDVADGFGTATSSWTLTVNPSEGPTRIVCSYGISMWTLPLAEGDRAITTYARGEKGMFLSPQSPGANKIPVFADATWVDAWPRAEDRTPPNLRDGDRGRQGRQYGAGENMLGRFTIARHGRAINIGFMDGHAETVPLDQLKRQTWHEGFEPQDWATPLPAH